MFRVFTPDLREVVFQGAIDPHTPIAQGWLRASHRKLDPAISTEYRPYHTHDERQPLQPGEVVPLDIELWPTSIVVPAGHRIALTVRGRDYEWGTVDRCATVELQERAARLRAVPARRPARPSGGGLRRQDHAALGPGAAYVCSVIPPT